MSVVCQYGNNGAGCGALADAYEGFKGGIESAFGGLEGTVTNLNTGIGGLSIPDDYLGGKVKSAVGSKTAEGSITSKISSLSSAVSGLKDSAISYVDGKAAEHRGHYSAWLAEQASKKNDDEDET